MNRLLAAARSLWFLGIIAIAFPAAAGSLSPRLQALRAAYRQVPKATVSRAVRTAATRRLRLLAPRVNGAGQVQVYIHYRPGAPPKRTALAGIGASGLLVSRPLGVVQAWVPIANLGRAAALSGVTRIGLPMYGEVPNAEAADVCKRVPTGLAIDSEGIAAQNVGSAQALGIIGTGVKVGIISDGATCIAASQAAGYLPGDVWVNPKSPGNGDEGTAMLEEVHALAPGAGLGFCGGYGGPTSAGFIQCLEDLAAWGAVVIADDLGFPDTWIYNNPGGSRFLAVVENFATHHPGISLVSAAGNLGGGRYLETDYLASADPSSPSGVPISLAPIYTPSPGGVGGRSYVAAMNFGAALGGAKDDAVTVTLQAGGTVDAFLTWNDPARGPFDDLDLFLLKPDGSVACAPDMDQWCSSTYDQKNSPTDPGDPGYVPSGEEIYYANPTDGTQTLYLVALCYACSAHGSVPLHVKLYGVALGRHGRFNYGTDGSVLGQAALSEEIAAAAAEWSGQGVTSMIEPYSGTGPFNYGDWLGGTHLRAKPDVTGADAVTVSGAGGFPSPFHGTSAAAPNVAAVIALLRGFAPDGKADAAGWKELVMATANPEALTNYRYDAGGVGLVDAMAGLAALDRAPVAQDGSLATQENTAASGRLEASDPDGQGLTYVIVNPPLHGSVRINDAASGSYTYTPSAGYSGADGFTFKAGDGILESNVASVSVTVNPAPSSGGGGSAWTVLAVLLGLAGFAALLRRRRA